MPTWGEYLVQIEARRHTDPNVLDTLRREALARVHAITGRPVVLYASRWVQGTGPGGGDKVSIAIEDLQGFMEAFHGIHGPSLDLILHTPGGTPSATAALVDYMRTRFTDVRVIVPLAAMSAGTMMTCSGNRIVLGKHSYLGPIDVQLLLDTPLGRQMVPALAIIKQFARAQKEIGASGRMSAWLPMLGQYGPGLLEECNNLRKLSEELVATWLSTWMFGAHSNRKKKSRAIAKRLNDHDKHLIHGRFLSRETIQKIGLEVDELEATYPKDQAKSQEFQDAVLSVLHMLTHTFVIAPQANKIIENHLGKAFITQSMPPQQPRMNIPFPFPGFPPGGPTIQPAPQSAPPPEPSVPTPPTPPRPSYS
jgi:hypothetical protein